VSAFNLEHIDGLSDTYTGFLFLMLLANVCEDNDGVLNVPKVTVVECGIEVVAVGVLISLWEKDVGMMGADKMDAD
jgi:hypothetical protein